MAYQVLARKSRPQTFDELIGQEPITTALGNALEEGRIAQAYLFSGIRGVGKTSAARILAKALNCETGPRRDPPPDDPICQEISAGADMDVLEVDAATYSKVEQVRELTESLRYGPARDRYKVVILDEVHRLSRQAFDALLKIIEEPPEHLVFIFATTEIEAVPATILSRCQEFHFRRVPTPVLAAHLRKLCDAEGIEASDASLQMIARAGEGSVRDAVALLDQLATFGSGTLRDEDTARLFGGLSATLFAELLEAILEGDGAAVVALARKIEAEGRDPRHVYAQFLAYCRDALHLSLGGGRDLDADAAELPQEDLDTLRRLAEGAGYENLLRLTHLLLASEPTVRRSEVGGLAIEIAWLRAAELPKLTRAEALLGGGGGGEAAKTPAPQRRQRAAAPPTRTAAPPTPEPSAEPPPPKAEPARATGSEAPVAETTAPAAPAPGAAPPSPPPEEEPPLPEPPPELAQPDPAAGNGAADDDPGRIQAFLEEVAKRKSALAARLDRTHPRIVDGVLELRIPAEDRSLARALARGANRGLLDQAVTVVWGEGQRWHPLEDHSLPAASPGGSEDVSAAAEQDEALVDAVQSNPTVQQVLDIFEGTVEHVERQGPSEPSL